MKIDRELHNEAMNIAFEAGRAERRGDGQKARVLFEKAFKTEKRVLDKMEPAADLLGWSIITRSAGWLAFGAGQMRTAERLACSALAGETDPNITPELRDLLEAIYLQPDDPDETDRVLGVAKSAIDRAVADEAAAPITYTETYEDVDYRAARPGFIVGIGAKDDVEGYEVLVMRKYGRGRRVEDVGSDN